MNKQVNLSQLGRKEVRKQFGDKENPIIIYNPSPEQKKEITKYLTDNFADNEGKEINISPEDIILDLLPLTSNIYLDLKRDNPEDMEMIKNILNDPQPSFESAIDEIMEVVREIGTKYIKRVEEILALPEEQLKKILPPEKELTEEEKRVMELEAELEKLKNKKVGE